MAYLTLVASAAAQSSTGPVEGGRDGERRTLQVWGQEAPSAHPYSDDDGRPRESAPTRR